MPDSLDLVAIIRALAIGLAAGLLARFIVYWIVERGSEEKRDIRYYLIGIIIVSLIIMVALSTLWPYLRVVPVLDNLSRAEAENLLYSNKLIPQSIEAYAPDTDEGRVIEGSQQPSYKLKVRPGETVTFTVATAPVISLLMPKTGDKVVCSENADKSYTFPVNGRSNATDYFTVLFWVQPANDRWYLQSRPINIDSQGLFSGNAQIGNQEWPPHDGDVINVAVTLTDKQIASQLLSQKGEVAATQPIGVKLDQALNVVVALKGGS
jgi:hypothetical protein